MRYHSLIYGKAEAIRTVIINRPEVGNAINLRLAEELADVFAEIGRDEEARAVVITGAGDEAFSVGADIKDLFSQATEPPSIAVSISALNLPVIAAINGEALNQGLELALACDIRVAVNTARFALNYVSLGLIPRDGATQRLPRLIGQTMSMEMLLTGRCIDAAEAYRIGMVHKVVSKVELMPVAMEMAHTIAAKAPLAVRYVKEAIYKGLDLTLEQGLQLEADLYCLLHTTEDRTEGIRAFLEKRSPKFKGR